MNIIQFKEKHRMQDYSIPRTLSRHQYGTLKFLADNKVTLADLKQANGTTLGSLAYRQYVYIASNGVGDKATVGLTHAGEEALKVYMDATLNVRSHEAEVTERCMRLLKHVRRSNVTPLRKTA